MGWPRAATMSGGIVSERATWAPPIGAIVSGSLLAFLSGKLAPTPMAGDDRAKGLYGHGENNPKLATWAERMATHLLPTPISSDGLDGGAFEDPEAARERSPRRGQKLQDMVALLPTPTAGDSRNSRNATANRSPGAKHHSGETLCDRLMGTPTATDYNSMELEGDDKGYLKHQVRGPMSPSLHLWLMGWPTGASSCEPLEREWFRSWLRAHGIDSPPA